MIAVSHAHLRPARIDANGNCFFRSVSLAVTGLQEFYAELRPAANYNVHYLHIKISHVRSPDESMLCLGWYDNGCLIS